MKSTVYLSCIIALIAAVGCGKVEPKTYYVAVNGSNDAAGTESAPWKTIQYAVNQGGPGVTIMVRAGSYNEKIMLTKGGSKKGYMTLQSYPDEKAVIDGTGIECPVDTPSGLILVSDLSYVKIIGFEVKNFKSKHGRRFPIGIHVRGASSYVEVRNNVVHDIQNETKDGESGAHGIAFYGTSKEPMTNLIVDNNEVYNCRLGWSESMVINGNITGFTVSNNYVHDNDNIGIDFIGHEGECPDEKLDQARNGVCVGNRVINIDTRMEPKLSLAYTGGDAPEEGSDSDVPTAWNPAYNGSRSADGIYVDGGKDIVIERNYVDFCNIGIEIASEHGGKSTSGVLVRNNLISNSHTCGIAFGGYDEERGSTENCRFYNNTLYNNSTDPDQMGSLCLQFDTRNNVVKNNIIYDLSGAGLIINEYTQNKDNVINNNIFFAPNSVKCIWRWKKKNYTSFEDYAKESGNDADSVFADPGFVDSKKMDFHIKTDSSAANKGSSKNESGDVDLDGKKRVVSVIDIGAFEIQ